MDEDKWMFIVVMLFTPIGWISIAVVAAAVGFVIEEIKGKKKEDGECERSG